ncbi:MAG TPA: ABC transporter permease subunit [Candidatus Eisenbergiella merdipullorum]|uniref:ABC transporter permease subunit n=1 Tax=Candidatus Eisenbergiella merdipullorum TaxID=2838553 RepID=A0A9D2I5Y3_9FIRM|nr:ABC transporter permease subunit [Candidatus Eisenbergiella merdipullorum]
MTKIKTAAAVPGKSGNPVALFKMLLAAGALLLVGGAVWYVAITGIVGLKDWDYVKYGLAPTIAAALGGAILILDIAAYFFLPCFKEASAPLKHDLKQDKIRYLLILPGIVLVSIFNYIPMYGIVLAFKDYKIKSGILFSEWCGLENFTRFFGRSVAGNVILNTLFIGVTQLIITFPVPIILALLLNELRSKKFRSAIQSTIYLPHFVSWIIMYSLLFSLFSVTSGMVNKLLMSMGLSSINLLSDPDMFYGMLYGTSIWKEAGWGTIIYMAAITGVDEEMYEAAYLDGANRFQRCLYITLPSIAFVVTTMLILNVGSVMGANFDQIMNLRTDATKNTVAQVIDTYVYDMGVEKGQYDLATAIGLFQQGVNCILLFISNFVVKKLSGEGFF